MELESGKKYKVNKNRLVSYIRKYDWNEEMLYFDYVTVVNCIDFNFVGNQYEYNGYTTKETIWWYPEDCLNDCRNDKLNRIL